VLVFVREVGAVDNATYRDLTGTETLKASAALRHLVDVGLLEKKGQSTATYYVPTVQLGRSPRVLGKGDMVERQATMVARRSDMLAQKSDMGTGAAGESRHPLYEALPEALKHRVDGIGPLVDQATMRLTLRQLCAHRAYPAEELALLVGRNARYLKERFLAPMMCDGELQYTIPDMPRHPNQAYRAPQTSE
jgi:ATP-dependent DNA helicase RecG